MKREYKELCERKKEDNEIWERKAKEVKRESDVWEIVNRERKRRRRIEEEIKMREWKEYFMGLLGGVENRVMRGAGGERIEGDDEAEISRIAIGNAIRRLREGKAAWLDKIPREAYGEDIGEWVWKLCNRIWKEEGWPEGWKEG